MEGGGDPNSGGPPPVPVPNQPIGELVNAVRIFADNGARIIDQISGGAENAIGTVADGVSDTVARALPIVIGFLSDVAGLGGVGTKVFGLIVWLSTFEEKLRRLEMLLATRAPKSVAERAAFTRFRISLGVVVQQGGAQLASKAAFANASIASGLVKGKL